MQINTNTRSVDLDPREAQFVQNPYPTYDAIRTQCGAFKWEQYGHWCFARYEDVNGLLRDRRFGRQILHVATREELGWPDVADHIRPFAEHEKHSLLELEPPVHTRLRGLINRAFLSRQVERLRPKLLSLCNSLIDGFEAQDEVDLLRGVRGGPPLAANRGRLRLFGQLCFDKAGRPSHSLDLVEDGFGSR